MWRTSDRHAFGFAARIRISRNVRAGVATRRDATRDSNVGGRFSFSRGARSRSRGDYVLSRMKTKPVRLLRGLATRRKCVATAEPIASDRRREGVYHSPSRVSKIPGRAPLLIERIPTAGRAQWHYRSRSTFKSVSLSRRGPRHCASSPTRSYCERNATYSSRASRKVSRAPARV